MFSLLSALASMGPYFAPSLAALACCLLPADCCLMCNSEVVAALKSLKTDFLPNFMNPSEVNHTYEWIVRTVKGFSDLPYNKNSYVGAVDEKTYNIVIKSFLKSLKNVTDSRIKGKQNFEKLKEMLRNEKVNFAFHAAQFQRLVHCRNKCVFPRNIEEWKPSGEFAPSEPNKEEEEEEETPSPTEAEPIVTQPFELQNMLQGRINGLVICFAIILIVAFIFWLLTRKKKKTKQKSSRASIDSKGSKTSKRRSSKTQKK